MRKTPKRSLEEQWWHRREMYFQANKRFLNSKIQKARKELARKERIEFERKMYPNAWWWKAEDEEGTEKKLG